MSFGEDINGLVAASTNGLHAAHHTWERVRLGDIATLTNGFPFKSSGFNEKEGMPVVRIRDVTSGEFSTLYRGSTDDPKMTFIESGQIAVGMDGDFNSRIWRAGRALLNQRVCTLSADERFFSQAFLAYVLPGYLKLINDHTSSVTVKHLSSKTIQDLPLPLPPLNEQNRIVDKIDMLFAQLDKGEEALRAVQKQLTRYRQSVLKAAVTGQLTADWRAENARRLEHGHDLLGRILQARRETWDGRGKYKEPAAPDTTDLPELPEGWVWASVDMVTRESLIGLVRSAPEQNTVGDGIRYVKMDRIDMNGYLDIETEVRIQASSAEVQRYSLAAGDILFNTRNSLELVGKNGIVTTAPHEPTVFNNNLMRIRLVSGALPNFINFQMCAAPFRKAMETIKRATTSVAAVYGGDLKALPLAIPSAEEQSEICVRLEEKLALVEAVATWCNTELARSAALRQSILKDAFAGRLVPQDTADEPAAALLACIKSAAVAKPSRRRIESLA